jgi:hypothetical protein
MNGIAALNETFVGAGALKERRILVLPAPKHLELIPALPVKDF